MVVDTADGNPGSLGDLAHGCAMKTIFKEKQVSGLQDLLAGVLAFGTGFVHDPTPFVNERSFIF